MKPDAIVAIAWGALMLVAYLWIEWREERRFEKMRQEHLRKMNEAERELRRGV